MVKVFESVRTEHPGGKESRVIVHKINEAHIVETIIDPSKPETIEVVLDNGTVIQAERASVLEGKGE